VSDPFCTGPGVVCVDDYRTCLTTNGCCKRCGAPGEPCCDGNLCEGGGCCDGGECVAAGNNCGSGGGVCSGSRCIGPEGSCGGLGDDYCSGVNCTAPYLYRYSSTCEPCGGEGEYCCQGSTEWCGPGLECDGSRCSHCGLSGEPCCDGSFCVTGSCDNFSDCP